MATTNITRDLGPPIDPDTVGITETALEKQGRYLDKTTLRTRVSDLKGDLYVQYEHPEHGVPIYYLVTPNPDIEKTRTAYDNPGEAPENITIVFSVLPGDDPRTIDTLPHETRACILTQTRPHRNFDSESKFYEVKQ